MCSLSESSSSTHLTSSGVLTFGSMIAGGGEDVSSIARISARPNSSRTEFTLTINSAPLPSRTAVNKLSVNLRASSLSFGAIPSSNSIHTISVPELTALGNISGRRPGQKIKLRLDTIFLSVTVNHQKIINKKPSHYNLLSVYFFPLRVVNREIILKQ